MKKDTCLHTSPQLEICEQSRVAVALNAKQVLSIHRKSELSGIPFSTLEEVYRRGYRDSLSEQRAFDRVNSFIAGGAAMKLDYDLCETKIERNAFLYMPPKAPKNTFAQCGTCEHFMPGKKRCSLFAANDVVVAEASCGLYAHGNPHDDQKFINAVTPKDAGYVNESVRCENCSWYNDRKCGLFEMLNKKAKADFQLNVNVDPKGCCNGWTEKPTEEQDVNEESKGLWANIHAKRERIKHGSGEHMRKPGSKGAPTKQDLIRSQSEEYTGAEKVSKNSNDPSSRFIGTNSLTDVYKKETPGYTKTVKRVVGEMNVRGVTGKLVPIKKEVSRGADMKLHKTYPGKSSSSGGGDGD